MTELIRRLVDSDDNCRWENNGWIHDQPLQEIYTCLQCLDDGMRADERARIIKLLEPLGKCEPSICRKGCRGEYRCIGWAYRHAIRLIKAGN